MIKKILVVVTVLITACTFAQDNTSSPYSYYGLGEIKFRGTHDNRAMGDLNIVGDSIHLNLMNPASYSNLRTTTLAIGGTSNFNRLSTSSDNEKAQRTTLDYLAVGFPIGKFGVSFGLTPFSAVGYQNQTATTQKSNVYTGEGSINSFFVGGSYKLTKSLSVGLDLSYKFGDFNTETIESLREPVLLYSTRERNNSNIKGITFTSGLLYLSLIHI